MLLVPTYIAASKVHGIGLFSSVPIKAGTLVWKFNPAIDALISFGSFERMTVLTQQYIWHYGSRIRPDLYMLCGDNARFVNHGEPGNIACQTDEIDCDDLALRDIEAGEEITEDYRHFCVDWANGLNNSETK